MEDKVAFALASLKRRGGQAGVDSMLDTSAEGTHDWQARVVDAVVQMRVVVAARVRRRTRCWGGGSNIGVPVSQDQSHLAALFLDPIHSDLLLGRPRFDLAGRGIELRPVPETLNRAAYHDAACQ